MKQLNKPKILAATYNPVSKTKMFTVMIDIPYSFLSELLQHKELNVSYKTIENITPNEVLENPFIPVWTEQQKGMSGKGLSEEKVKKADKLWLDNLKEKEFKEFLFWSNEDGDLCSIDCNTKPNKKNYDLNNKEELEEYTDELDEYNSHVDRFQECDGESVEYELETLKSKYDELIATGVHKQNANRLLAPFAYTTCILSGTEWENFFELRCPKYTFQTSWGNKVYSSKKEALAANPPLKNVERSSDHTHICNDFTEKDWQAVNESGAQPEFQIIAEMIYDLYREAKFEEKEYHIPFEKDIKDLYFLDICRKFGLVDRITEKFVDSYYNYLMLVSASMCAKLSYDTQDKEDTLEKHLERAQLLKTHKHAEPFSHQAVAMLPGEYEHGFYKSTIKLVKNAAFGKERAIVKELGWCYNNRGFITQRYLIENLQ